MSFDKLQNNLDGVFTGPSVNHRVSEVSKESPLSARPAFQNKTGSITLKPDYIWLGNIISYG